MPKIDAQSIEEHVRLQTGRILDAAAALFQERGYRRTDMEDIAEAVGLARNSLYRYFSNKDTILLACVQRDMVPFMAEMRALGERFPDPLERLGAWLDAQIDIATSPAHATMEMMGEIRRLAPELRKEVMQLHALPNAVLAEALAPILKGKRRDLSLITALVAGMVEAASRQAIEHGNKSAVKRELRRSVEAILAD
jgi:AcrR family transcriptional regulator